LASLAGEERNGETHYRSQHIFVFDHYGQWHFQLVAKKLDREKAEFHNADEFESEGQGS
jgi:hypothetical protein